mmetsp:Transcript_46817/g.141820  ORF Transcript_46817/g.141820 Transcript_46817/m.141820 type:complete len:94 (-) Transcript_46817:59-340(-)
MWHLTYGIRSCMIKSVDTPGEIFGSAPDLPCVGSTTAMQNFFMFATCKSPENIHIMIKGNSSEDNESLDRKCALRRTLAAGPNETAHQKQRIR